MGRPGPKSPLVVKPNTLPASGGGTSHTAPLKPHNKKAVVVPTPDQLAAAAQRIVRKAFDGSDWPDRTNDVPKFQWNELQLGKILGKGGFGTVSEVRGFVAGASTTTTTTLASSASSAVSRSQRQLLLLHHPPIRSDPDDDSEVELGGTESRQFISEHCLRHGGDARYAVKILSPETVQNPSLCLQGTIDLVVEARLLSAISHPNIVKMRALSSSDPYREGYFLVLDRLYDTLEARLLQWATRRNRISGLAGKVLDRTGHKTAALYEERLVGAYDLAAALAHLHDQRLVYRDLKPENIGFDIRGDIKIFDFGLAKELRDALKNDDGSYRLTEMTGSPRYMAPEVANGVPYTEKCDVYSFAILLWEMLALKRPFELYTAQGMRDRVYNAPHKRPNVDPSWPNALKIGLKRAWDPDWRSRSTMTHIESILRQECVAARRGDESGLEHNRRRSTFVFRPHRQAQAPSPSSAARPTTPRGLARPLVRTPPTVPSTVEEHKQDSAASKERQEADRDTTEIDC